MTRNTAKRGKSPRKSKPSARAALAIGLNPKHTAKARAAALRSAPLAVCANDANLQAMLKVVRDTDEPSAVRLAALQSLQAASFSVVAFESCRREYIAALRAVVTDPDPELRQRALGLLAREKDRFAQTRLLDGLQHPDKALVPPEKALQLLSYDLHAEGYAAARAIVAKPPNDTARCEALRLLAADPDSAPLFEKLLRDKNELAAVRQISAAALQALKPKRLQTLAREMVLDKGEYDDIRATSLTALTQFGDPEATASDASLLKAVDGLRSKGSPKIKQSARRFLNRYGR